eukprot:CAMPEP_0198679392 /NCGR_PEP_ID=MMETSP1468-20131203/2674_1 /TAXON_ID=1461545 /ORGANISM="Mantoniella sp, Strain CCMP1436" /LENGTH=112 /DNA_ID=CAMNT_0044418081 /DNA_START=123 /DNA_END=461 /DNA_ORIENTATION=-
MAASAKSLGLVFIWILTAARAAEAQADERTSRAEQITKELQQKEANILKLEAAALEARNEVATYVDKAATDRLKAAQTLAAAEQSGAKLKGDAEHTSMAARDLHAALASQEP